MSNEKTTINGGGLWKSKSGNALSGPFCGGRIVIIPNPNKKTEKHPDYVFFFAPNEEREQKQPKTKDDDIDF